MLLILIVYILKLEKIEFDQLLSVEAPGGYQVDYCLPFENSNTKNGIIYGYIDLKFTNTEPVTVRCYYDTEQGRFIDSNFGKIKAKTLEKK